MQKLLLLAAVLTLTASAFQKPQTPAAPSTPADQKCVLTGRVVNAETGEPLRKATLHLMLRSPNGVPQNYMGTSQADGTFRFEGVEPGAYNLSGERFGFLNTSYGQKGNNIGLGSVINLRPGQETSDIILKLMPQAVISGKVVDEDGDPIDDATVQVLAQTWMRGKLRYMARGGNSSNDRGEFRIANLAPGKYYLAAERREMNFQVANETPAIPGKPEIGHIRTYFPDAVNLESAAPIEVKAGQDLPGMDIHLRSAQTYHVRGRVAGYSAAESQRSMLSIAPREDEFPGLNGIMRFSVNKDGTFDLSGIAPGSYTLTAMNAGNGPVRAVARQSVDVGAGDVNDVVLNFVTPGGLSGRIQIEGVPPAGVTAANLARVRVTLSTDGPFMAGPLPNATPAADGTFKLENVSTGKYYFHAAPAPDGAYLKSVRFGQQEMLGKELDFSQGVSGELEIVFSYGAAEIDGTVQQTQEAVSADSATAQPAAGPSASIILVPDVLNADGSGMLFSGTRAGGNFTIKQVPPGHYRAYAFEQMNINQLQNPDILKQLESKGTEVEVRENDKKQIQLSLISNDEVQQILAKLGIASQ